MDFTTTIVAVVIVLLCILPIFLMNESRRRRERRGKATLQEMAKENNTSLAHFYAAQHYMLGISEDKQWLFFARLAEKNNYSRTAFNLNNYTRCTVEHDEHQEGPKSDRSTIIDQVRLFLSPKQGIEPAQLVLFDATADQQTHSDELRIAEEWQRVISNCL